MTGSINEDFKIAFDPSAFATLEGKTLDIEKRIRREILDLLYGDLPLLGDLIFHVIDPDGRQPLMCEPFEDSNGTFGILVTAATYKSLGPLEKGPFKGKEVMMPYPEDDEDEGGKFDG